MASDPVALTPLAIATAGVVAIEGLARWAIAQQGVNPLAAIGAARLLGIGWMALIVSHSRGGWSRTGMVGTGWMSGLIRGFVWSAGFGILAAFGFALLHLAGFEPLRIIRPKPTVAPSQHALLFLVGGLIAPIAEELYFRGLLYGYLRRWGFWPALLLSTLVFTVLHQGALGTILPQAVGGLVFATAYEIEKNLLVPIVIHALGNAAIFSLTALF